MVVLRTLPSGAVIARAVAVALLDTLPALISSCVIYCKECRRTRRADTQGQFSEGNIKQT